MGILGINKTVNEAIGRLSDEAKESLEHLETTIDVLAARYKVTVSFERRDGEADDVQKLRRDLEALRADVAELVAYVRKHGERGNLGA